jgi:hypothetical protein
MKKRGTKLKWNIQIHQMDPIAESTFKSQLKTFITQLVKRRLAATGGNDERRFPERTEVSRPLPRK